MGPGVSATPRHARPDHRVGEGPLLACFCWNWRRWANVERLMQYLGPAVVVIVLSAARGAPDTLGLTATAVLLPTMVSFTFHATNTDACDSTDTSALRSARPVPPIDGRVQSCAAWLQPRLMEVSMLNPRLAQTVAMWVILAAGSVWQGAVVFGLHRRFVRGPNGRRPGPAFLRAGDESLRGGRSCNSLRRRRCDDSDTGR